MLSASGSLVSDYHFKPILNGIEQLVALNATDQKATVTLRYRGRENGVLSDARVRLASGFLANSADFIGTRCIGDLVEDCVEATTISDLSLGDRIPNTGEIAQLSVSDLFDADYRNCVGVPQIGRMALLQLKYEF